MQESWGYVQMEIDPNTGQLILRLGETLYIWDTTTNEWQILLNSGEIDLEIGGFAISPDGQFILVTDGEEIVQFSLPNLVAALDEVDRQSPIPIWQFRPFTDLFYMITTLTFSPDSATFIVGTVGRDRSRGSLILYPINAPEDAGRSFANKGIGIIEAQFSPDGRQLMSSSIMMGSTENDDRRGLLNLWDVATGNPVFAPLSVDEDYFVTVTVEGNSYMEPIHEHAVVYTGDVANPQVILREKEGYRIPANMKLQIERPTLSSGTLLVQHGGYGVEVAPYGDKMNPRSAALVQLERKQGSPLIPTEILPSNSTYYPLYDDGLHDDGAMESDGVFGNIFEDLYRVEGHYTFHAQAEYHVEGQRTTREFVWTQYVGIGIDPEKSKPTTTALPSDGKPRYCLEITPQDRYGNFLGPGRLDAFNVKAAEGNRIIKALEDLGNGSYRVCVEVDSNQEPGVVIEQPYRKDVEVKPDGIQEDLESARWQVYLMALFSLLALFVVIYFIIQFASGS